MDDLQQYLDSVTDAIYNDVVNTPDNWVFVDAILSVGDFDGPGGNFMWGFTNTKPMDFDTFAAFRRGLIESLVSHLTGEHHETVDMSAAYDDYLQRVASNNEGVPLDEGLSKRWDALVSKHDANGMTGAMYGYVCRRVQDRLRKLVAGN